MAHAEGAENGGTAGNRIGGSVFPPAEGIRPSASRRSDPQSAFTSCTSRSSDFFASPKSISVRGL